MIRRRLFSAALTVAAMLLAGHASAAGQGPSVLIETGTVHSERIGQRLTVYGQVVPDPEHVTGISAAHGGQIARLWVGLGQQVAAGQPLLTLTTDPTARLAYEQARAQVAYARRNLAQVKSLYAEQLATRAELAKAEQSLVNAQGALRAERRLGTNHAQQIIRAPQSAIVTRLDVAPGDRVQAGAPLLSLGARERLWVTLGIEPEDVTRLHPGMPVVLRPVFARNQPLHADLSQVHAVINPSTHLVDAVVPLSGSATLGLIPGMWMRGYIDLQRHEALTVPSSAVLHDANGAYLFVVADGHAQRLDVATGISRDGRTAVRAPDLHAGETVVTVGNYELRNGMAVRLAAGHS